MLLSVKGGGQLLFALVGGLNLHRNAHGSVALGFDLGVLQIRLGGFFEIHGLPDAADLTVALLAAGLIVPVLVSDADADLVFFLFIPIRSDV